MKKIILFILAIIFLYICIYFFIRNTYFSSKIIEGNTNQNNVKDNALITYSELAANSSMSDISNNAKIVNMIKNTITDNNSNVYTITNDNNLDDIGIIKKIAKYYNVSLSPSFYTLKENVQTILNNNTSSLWFSADNSSNFIFDNTRIRTWKDTQQKFNATTYGNIHYNSTNSSVVLPIGSYFKSSLNIGVPAMTWFFVFSTDINFNANGNFNGDHFILASSVVPWTNYAIQVYKNQIYIPIIGGSNNNGMNIYVDTENIVANKVYLLSISFNASSENNYSYETTKNNSIIRLNGINLDIESGGSSKGYTFTNSNGVQFGGLLDNAYTNDRNQYIYEIIAISGKNLSLNDIVMVETYLNEKWNLKYTIDTTNKSSGITSINSNDIYLPNGVPEIPLSKLKITDYNTYSVTFWIFVNRLPTSYQCAYTADDNNSTNNHDGLYNGSPWCPDGGAIFYIDENFCADLYSNGTFTIYNSRYNGKKLPSLMTKNFPIQKWTYVVVSIENNSFINLYINGQLKQSANYDKTSPGGMAQPNPNQIVRFGKHLDATIKKIYITPKVIDQPTALSNYNLGINRL